MSVPFAVKKNNALNDGQQNYGAVAVGGCTSTNARVAPQRHLYTLAWKWRQPIDFATRLGHEMKKMKAKHYIDPQVVEHVLIVRHLLRKCLG